MYMDFARSRVMYNDFIKKPDTTTTVHVRVEKTLKNIQRVLAQSTEVGGVLRLKLCCLLAKQGKKSKINWLLQPLFCRTSMATCHHGSCM